jgi:hypothetical protein
MTDMFKLLTEALMREPEAVVMLAAVHLRNAMGLQNEMSVEDVRTMLVSSARKVGIR